MNSLTIPYVLAPYVRAGFQQKSLFLGFGSIQRKIDEPRLQECLIDLAADWKRPATLEEMRKRHEPRHGMAVLAEALEILRGGRYLIEAGTYRRADRYSRHSLFYQFMGAEPAEVQARLARAHVVVLGCGGIGNQMAAALATAGVGELTLVDNDTIELSNLTRQILFTEEDEGASKTRVLKRELERRSSPTRVHAIEMRVERYEDLHRLPRADLILLSADLPAATSWVNRYCVETRTPFLNVGYVNDIAVWGPFVRPGRTSCWACQTLVARDPVPQGQAAKLQGINSGYQAPSIGPVNMMSSAHALMDVFRFLGGFGTIESDNRRIGVWTAPLRVETQECPRNPDCRVCGGIAGSTAEVSP